MLERRFGDIGIVLQPLAVMSSIDLRPQASVAGELPAGRDLAGVERACRPALLVDARLELLGILEMAPAALQRQSSRVGFHDSRTAVESSGPVSMFQRCWSGSRPLKRLTSSLTRSSTMPAGQHAEADVGRIEPVVADRRFGRIQDRLAVHEGRRAERRLAGQPGVEEDAALRPDVLRDRARQLHEEVVRVLAVDQPVDAVGGLAAGEQQRIAALAHQRVGAEHRPELQRAVAERPPGHAHQHAATRSLVVAARGRTDGRRPG